MNSYVKAFESYRQIHTHRPTDTNDQNYIPRRFAGGQKFVLSSHHDCGVQTLLGCVELNTDWKRAVQKNGQLLQLDLLHHL